MKFSKARALVKSSHFDLSVEGHGVFSVTVEIVAGGGEDRVVQGSVHQ